MTRPIDRNQLYTYGEVCDLLNVSRNWLRLRRQEGLPIVQCGNRVWIDGGDLVAFLKGYTRGNSGDSGSSNDSTRTNNALGCRVHDATHQH